MSPLCLTPIASSGTNSPDFSFSTDPPSLLAYPTKNDSFPAVQKLLQVAPSAEAFFLEAAEKVLLPIAPQATHNFCTAIMLTKLKEKLSCTPGTNPPA